MIYRDNLGAALARIADLEDEVERLKKALASAEHPDRPTVQQESDKRWQDMWTALKKWSNG